MKIYELNFGENPVIPNLNTEIAGLCRRTADIRKDCLFFDLPSVSGIDRIYEFDTLPLAIVTERASVYEGLDIPIIEVSDARRAFAYAYSDFLGIDYSKFRIIGITGTNGKSSVCKILAKMLSAQGKKCGIIGTGIIEADGKELSGKYYSMTTPDAEILYPAISKMQSLGIEYILMEVSSHALALSKCEPIDFEIGIFTGLSPEHLDFHKNLDNYFEAKRRLFKKAHKAIILTDGRHGKMLDAEFKYKSVSAGFDSEIIRAENITEHGFSGSDFTLNIKGRKYAVSIKLPGIYNIKNSLAALSCINELSLDLEKAINALSHIEFIKGRFEVIQGSITVIRDFAHTECALDNLLKTIKSCIIPGQTLTVVLGCGGERDKFKRPLMAKCASLYAERVIITEDNSRGEELSSILSDIIFGVDSQRVGIIADRSLAIEYAITSASDGDTVVIVGKGAEDYIIEKQGYRHFDERKIITDALQKRI